MFVSDYVMSLGNKRQWLTILFTDSRIKDRVSIWKYLGFEKSRYLGLFKVVTLYWHESLQSLSKR